MILIQGFPDSDKVPGFVGESVFGAGPINIRTIPLVLLLVGLMAATHTGTATADADVLEITSKDDADTYFDPGSELNLMCSAAIDSGSGYKLMAAPVALASGNQATCTVTYTGTAGASGTYSHWFGGFLVQFTVPAGTTATQAGDALVVAISKVQRMPVTAVNAAGVVTVSWITRGVRGNDAIAYQDITYKPTVQTVATTGGAAVSSTAIVSGCRFTGGTGTEVMATTLANLLPGRYHRIAVAENDSVSLAAWKAQNLTKGSALEGRMEHMVYATNGTLSAATSLAQTTLNTWRFQAMWLKDCETPAPMIAASMGAIRASTEQSQPNSGYDDVVLPIVKAQRFASDRANRTTFQSALDSGVTPLASTETEVSVVRAITTRSLNGVIPDYRTLDTASSVVTDFVRDDLKIFWITEFKPSNKYNRPDPGPGEKPVKAGVATPSLWNSKVKARLLDMQDDSILTGVDTPDGQPMSEFNTAGNRIMSVVPVIPLPLNHQIGVSVRQMTL